MDIKYEDLRTAWDLIHKGKEQYKRAAFIPADVMEQNLFVAFSYGFMITREGFNAECAYDHCAPTSYQSLQRDFDNIMHQMESSEKFMEYARMFVRLIMEDLGYSFEILTVPGVDGQVMVDVKDGV